MITKIKNLLRKSNFLKSIYHVTYVRVKNKWKQFWIQRYGIRYISEITNTLNSNGVITFVDFGSLLGIVREGHLMYHDIDIDIGVISNSIMTGELIYGLLSKCNYRLVREFKIKDSTKEQSYYKKHIRIDIQFYVISSEQKMMCYLFYEKEAGKQKWYAVEKSCTLVQSVKDIIISKNKIYIPDNAETLLRDKYGENWRIPDKGWVYWKGPNTKLTNTIGEFKRYSLIKGVKTAENEKSHS